MKHTVLVGKPTRDRKRNITDWSEVQEISAPTAFGFCRSHPGFEVVEGDQEETALKAMRRDAGKNAQQKAQRAEDAAAAAEKAADEAVKAAEDAGEAARVAQAAIADAETDDAKKAAKEKADAAAAAAEEAGKNAKKAKASASTARAAVKKAAKPGARKATK